MKTHVKNNLLFFALLSMLAVIGAVYLITSEKADLILYFSQNRNPVLDHFFRVATKFGEEPAYFLIGIALLFHKTRFALLIGATGLVTMGVSFGLKAFFAIERPMAYFTKAGMADEINLVSGVQVFTGATSFPSGHAMSAFALYGMLIFLLPNKKRIVLPILFLALSVSISRVYLVQHFFPDIYAGSLIGVVIALIIFLLNQKITLTDGHFLERSVLGK